MAESSEPNLTELLREKLLLDDKLAHYQQAVTVLFVDIVGSTRFYEKYGDVAGLAMVQRFLDRFLPIIEQHEGRVVKTIGDAILARFETAHNAVFCALGMQWSLLEFNEGRTAAEQMHIRVALNCGFALIKDTDVFGDVVNVCSRIESAARPDEILISPSVYDQICHREEIAVRKRAEGVQLKGKTEKMDLYEVVWRFGEPVEPAPQRPSESQVALAALPDAVGNCEPAVAELPKETSTFPRLPGGRVAGERERRWHWRRWAAAGATLLVAAAVAMWFYVSSAAALSETDTILIGDFVNKTGDPVFDGTLKTGLTVKLAESPFLNIFPAERVRETLRLMNRTPEEPLSGAMAREICQRQGIRAMITGEIAPMGSRFVVSLTAANCQTGEPLAQRQLEADSKEHVLEVLGEASSRLRSKLGESLKSLESFDKPLPQVTTSLLEALRAYALAAKEFEAGKYFDAVPHFKRALELDPNFASAYYYLGSSYWNLGETHLAKQYASKAFELRDRVTERERYRITHGYHLSGTGGLEKATANDQLWILSYPRDMSAHNNLGLCYGTLGLWDKALIEFQEALRFSDVFVPYSNVATTLLFLNRFDEAKAMLEKARDKNFAVSYGSLYGIAFIEDDRAGMKRLAEEAKGMVREPELRFAQAESEAFQGRIARARQGYHEAVELSLAQKRTQTAYSILLAEALTEAELGNVQQARRRLAEVNTRSAAQALILARVGDVARAESIRVEIAKSFPSGTLAQRVWLPTIAAAIELHRGNAPGAVEALQVAGFYMQGYNYPGFPSYIVPYLRGQAYLQISAGSEAAAEFQTILEHRGVNPTSPFYALSHLGLARAFAVAGEKEKARAKYAEFLALWKGADTDLPLNRQAKAEYARLK